MNRKAYKKLKQKGKKNEFQQQHLLTMEIAP